MDPRIRGARPRSKGAMVALPAAILILGVMFPALAMPPQTHVLSGDCSHVSEVPSRTMFVVENARGTPAEGVKVTADGVSKVTNSSGVVVFLAGNFTSFSVGLPGASYGGVLADHQPFLICYGTSYYRVVWLTVGTGGETQQSQPAA